MARAVWNGHISFGLIQIPVELHSAERRTDIHFHMIDSRNQARVRYERVNEETGEEVPWDEIVKGYEYEDGRYVLLEDEEFKRVAPEVTKTVELSGFVEAATIEPIYFEKPYYLVPGKKGDKPYMLLRESLRRSGKAGVASVVIRTRQYLALVLPRGPALMLTLLRFAQELREADEFRFPEGSLSDYKITGKEVAMAEQLIESMTEDWDPAQYKDEYRAALLAFIEKKAKSAGKTGRRQRVEPEEPPAASADVIDLMELLKRSMNKKKTGGGSESRSSPRRKKAR
ncbi:MAG: Ku protein [Thiohalobacteraceae bacterium]